jgi:predicted solute-binding protein
MRIAKIPYLNSQPFYGAFGKGAAANAPGAPRDPGAAERDEAAAGFDLVEMPPSELGRLARADRIDAGLIPTVDYFAVSKRYERLGSFGIAVTGRVESVLLLSERPLAALTGARIGVTEETSTSYRLLRLLVEAQHGARPATYMRGARASVDAYLVIGDEALATTAAGPPAPFVIDLAEEWSEWQRLPFVFAVWVARTGLPADEKARLAALLERSLSGEPGGGAGAGDDVAREAGGQDAAALRDDAADTAGVPGASAAPAVAPGAETAMPELWDDRTHRAPTGASDDVIARIVEAYASGPPARRALGSVDRLCRYLARFTYRLGESEETDITRFHDLLEENRLAGDLH